MIITASRRTDIPAFYSEWLMNRLQEGCALVPNPRNAGRLSRVELSPEHVDCIVFWTKNPAPMLDKLTRLDAMGYAYYFQFTLTPYDHAVERGLPPKPELVKTFIELSRRTGPSQVVWRYDPVLIDSRHSVKWHVERFSELCEALGRSTRRCFLSFIDAYKSIGAQYRAMTQAEMRAIAEGFSGIAEKHRIALFTCAEGIDLTGYGIRPGACVDGELIEQLVGCPIRAKKDPGQRAACRCIEAADLGAYDTCPHGCGYCYATSSRQAVLRRVAAHDPRSPLITGWPNGDETITSRTRPSFKVEQTSLF